MSAIPDDIWKTAAEVWADLPAEGAGITAIAKAILSERNRCAGVAREEYQRRFENRDGYSAARVHDFLVVAVGIEKAIAGNARAFTQEYSEFTRPMGDERKGE